MENKEIELKKYILDGGNILKILKDNYSTYIIRIDDVMVGYFSGPGDLNYEGVFKMYNSEFRNWALRFNGTCYRCGCLANGIDLTFFLHDKFEGPIHSGFQMCIDALKKKIENR